MCATFARLRTRAYPPLELICGCPPTSLKPAMVARKRPKPSSSFLELHLSQVKFDLAGPENGQTTPYIWFLSHEPPSSRGLACSSTVETRRTLLIERYAHHLGGGGARPLPLPPPLKPFTPPHPPLTRFSLMFDWTSFSSPSFPNRRYSCQVNHKDFIAREFQSKTF